MSSTDHRTAAPGGGPPAEPPAPDVLELAGEFPAGSQVGAALDQRKELLDHTTGERQRRRVQVAVG